MSGAYQPGDYSGDRDLDRYGYRRAPGLPGPGSAAVPPQDAAVAAALAARSRPDEYGHLAGASSYYAAAAAAAAARQQPPMPYGNPYATLQGPPRSLYPAASPLGEYVAHKQAAVQHAVAAANAEYAASYPYAIHAGPPSYADPTMYGSQTAHEIAIMQEAFRNERAASLKRNGYQANFGPPMATARGPLPTALQVARTKGHRLATPHTPSSMMGGRPSGSPGSGSEEASDDDDDDDDDDDLQSGDENGAGGDDDDMLDYSAKGQPMKKKETAVMSEDPDGKPIVIDRGHTWYIGSVPLGVDDDKYWLSELQVYLRANFAEAFAATDEDIAAPMHGRNKPIALGQVGIRCMHCKSTYGGSSVFDVLFKSPQPLVGLLIQATRQPNGDSKRRRTRA
jgi:hypothetical protein